jgi:putative PIN family toxin of toxin-antitoxin system
MKDIVIIDTNVFVAGVRSRHGASFAVLHLALTDRIHFGVSVSLAAEYEDVLIRHLEHTAFTAHEMDSFIDAIYYAANFIEVHYLWRPFLKDPDDDHVLEVAVAAQSKYIITHNLKDFEGIGRFGIKALSPADYLKEIGEA